MDNRRQYIVEAAQKVKHKNGFQIKNLKIFISSNPDFNIENFFENAAKKIPEALLSAVNTIYVGDFIKGGRALSGKTHNDIVYLSDKRGEKEMLSDLIHELAHAFQNKFHKMVFSDQSLEKEFLSKREKLFHRLTTKGIPTMPYVYFESPKYDKGFDSYLYNNLGYDNLRHFISGIYPTCYSVTSLGEYFSVGVECMLTGKSKMLEDCPVLRKKVGAL